MFLIERNKDVITGNEDLEFLYSFKDFPIFMGCVDTPINDDIKADMNWWISRSSGCVQLNPLIPLDVLYKSSHGAGSTGGVWREHHDKFADFINKFNVKSALEIGAGHGELSQRIVKSNPNIGWTIIEPNPLVVKPTKNINVIIGFFDGNEIEGRYDTVVHSQLFEHIYDIDKFVGSVSKILEIGGKHIFAIPNMREMLKRKYTNVLNFEHTMFLTEELVEYLLNKHGFEIVRKEYFLDAHSIFYASIKVCDEIKLINQYDENKKLFIDFVEYHKKYIDELNKKISEFNGEVYLFGAHIFSQYLINFGLDIDKVTCILDNDINKQDKRLYGSPLMVKSPKILKDKNNVAVILKASMYNKEIKKDILENINDKIMFWE